jgi:hypothetical protein
MRKPLTLSIITLLYSCSAKPSICENDTYITSLVRNSELDKGRSGDNILIYYTFQGSKTNQYTVLREVDDPTSFCLDKSFIEYEDRLYSEGKIVSYVRVLNEKLDSLGIRAYSGKPDGLGSILRLYMKNGEVIYKTQPISQITCSATLQEIKTSRILCSNWYSLD